MTSRVSLGTTLFAILFLSFEGFLLCNIGKYTSLETQGLNCFGWSTAAEAGHPKPLPGTYTAEAVLFVCLC